MNNGLRSVSIIIPTYNRAKMLGPTIESCINQTYPKDLFEII
ncbi:MAG: glycosyltransferase, partial [bacterium]